MDKDKILERAKKTNMFNDEAKNNKRLKGNDWGLTAMLFVSIVLWIMNYINGKDSTQIVIIFTSFIGFSYLGRYFANKEKTDLLSAIGGVLLFVGSFVIGVSKIWNL